MKQLLILVPILLTQVAQAQEPIPVGDEFQINTYTTGDQWKGSVAMTSARGDFVVVWESYGSYGTDTGASSVQGQRYATGGAVLGDQFQVNIFTTNKQAEPRVAADAQGDFFVVWASEGSYGTDTDSWSIQGQRYDVGGTPQGDQFQVNTYTTNRQSGPAIAAVPQGDFVVVWNSLGSFGTDTSSSSIQGQRYDASGTPVGGEFQVNTYTTAHQSSPAVAVDDHGDFVVVWSSYGSNSTDTSYSSIQAQRFGANGVPVGGQFQVNTYTTYDQFFPAAAVADQGNFVVVWESYGSYGTDTSLYSIQAQRYDASGTPVGVQFQVNTYTTYHQLQPAAAVDDQGDFVVVWSSRSSGTDTDWYSIQTQRYDAGGTPVGDQFQVNSYTTGDQWKGSVAVSAQGDFVVVWESEGSNGSDTSASSAQGQRYASSRVFADGFESGDTLAWTSTVQ